MKNDAYWTERMKQLEKALLDKGYDYAQNLEAQFNEATFSIEKELAVWYQRLAKNNEINLADAKKLLNAGELKEFRWTVEEYIKHGRENALDGRWLRELENASARVHISRLDSIKLQLQQQAEVLYGNQLDGVDELARDIYSDSFYHTAFELQKGLGVGWSFATLNEDAIRKALSRPWTADGQTFRDRCWTNKEALVRSVNRNLTQMIMRGEAPDKAISAISKEFGVSRRKAGRLVMTESAAFASAGQRDCYNALEVEKYRIVETLDGETCPLCGELDGKVFKMSDFAVGETAPPFHPWCRGCTCPHFDDMDSERAARDADGKTYYVPSDMKYGEWQYYNQAIAREPKITADISAIARATGGKLEGLDFRVKTPESFLRKTRTDMADGLPERDALAQTYDVVRYTNMIAADKFAANYENTMYKLGQSGYNISRVKNTIADKSAPYRGLNTVVTSPDGFHFELQFHTPESFALKQANHALYERERMASTFESEKARLRKEMREMTGNLKTPQNAETIKSFDNLR